MPYMNELAKSKIFSAFKYESMSFNTYANKMNIYDFFSFHFAADPTHTQINEVW